MRSLTKSKFKKIIKIASQSLREVKKKGVQKKNGNYIGKKTHQHKSANTSEKQRDIKCTPLSRPIIGDFKVTFSPPFLIAWNISLPVSGNYVIDVSVHNCKNENILSVIFVPLSVIGILSNISLLALRFSIIVQ